MNILTIDTSTSLASVAITRDAALVAESVFLCDRSLSARLIPEIERLLDVAGLAMEDIDLFAGSVGPGSFTGVRAGLATLQGLSLATGKKCAGFSSLALLAMNFALNPSLVCTMLDARKQEVYAALFDSSQTIPLPLIQDCVLPPERFLQLLEPWGNAPVIFAGEGALRYHDLISETLGARAVFASAAHNVGRAGNGTVLARHATPAAPDQLLPVYLRASEAEYAKLNRQQSKPAGN
ncbi:tRNA (adenosine(37)-N6)-threonylcarbamoyltransferase complex dimerization subunit type 1 TsaB [Pelotalea chapellei]|uniref:tRNA (Adenosine(37)-N6)-threonylcarbamoyltransferase complex dimerization subunit type 1 TsaB n=1 Tax=Pelotalea chapellei TaxID=44671 RepID=A0ABS5UB14_9BACT|nr:tRNA (adenosine(37)-N6)-threonylcarbamoyltransferase complex dimerization subunit type 1 TsaB [Pelotalea chapellei]MBT1072833.1 tRNA (adenosine(37)-N6)-threonylcarbamoyltransferase complex dimerization subunit type 1 TsaB [Pelotalea chapellei]